MDAVTSQPLAGQSIQAFLRRHLDTDGRSPAARADSGRRAYFGHHAVRNAIVRATDRTPPVSNTPSTQATATARGTPSLSYQRSESTSLFIKTQEGDTVQLKISAKDAATTDGANDGATTLAALNLQTNSSLRISFSVDGKLNAEEQTAINDVIKQVGALAQDFFAGDLPSAFATAQNFQVDAQQLANVGVHMSMRQQLTYSQSPATQPPPTPAASMPTYAPATSPAMPATAADSATSITPSPTPMVAALPPSAAASDTLEPTSTTPPETSPITHGVPSSMVGAIDTVRSFLTQLMDKLAAPTGVDTATVGMSLKLKIFQSTVTSIAIASPSLEPGAAPLPALVPQTLDTLAAQQEPPLHAQA